MVVRRLSSSGRRVSPRPMSVHRRVGHRLGCISRRRPSLRLVVSPLLSVFHQPPRASGGSVSSSGFPSFSLGTCGGGVLRQHHCLSIPQEAGWYSIHHSQHGGSVSPQVLRGLSHPASSSVHPRQDERPRRFSELQEPGHRFRVDSLCGGVSPASSPLASHHQPLCDLPQSLVAGLLFPTVDPQSAGTDAMLQSWDGLQAYAFPPFGLLSRVLAKVRQSQGLELTLIATTSMVPGLSGASGGDPLLPATMEGSSQTAPLPSLSPEPPRASADCLAYIQRSARHSGFSSVVARQLTLCRRRSTRVNYQAKWAVYHAWCHRHGHSVSRPSMPKVADFLLYLRRSLSLSYSSTASYRSMLSGVFRFILPELSSHIVLHDLLRSFCLERPLPSSRVPPWDLLLVFRFLRGPPFEPVSSCSLRDLTQKVLFLVSLATACWRTSGCLSGCFLFWLRHYLSHLPEFRAKTEPSANPLPRSFCVRSQSDFAGDLPDELLLCPVRALRLYLNRVSSISPRPRTLFLSSLSFSLSLKMLLASFFGTSSLGLTPLRLLRLFLPRLGLLLLLLPRLLPFVHTVFVGLLLLGPSLVTLLFPLFWRLPLGLPLRSLCPSTSGMFNSPHPMVLVWVLWWRLVMSFNWLRVFMGFKCWFLCYPFQLRVVSLWEGGHCSLPLSLRRVCILRRRSSECGF